MLKIKGKIKILITVASYKYKVKQQIVLHPFKDKFVSSLQSFVCLDYSAEYLNGIKVRERNLFLRNFRAALDFSKMLADLTSHYKQHMCHSENQKELVFQCGYDSFAGTCH